MKRQDQMIKDEEIKPQICREASLFFLQHEPLMIQRTEINLVGFFCKIVL